LVLGALVIKSLPWVLVKTLLARGWPTCQGTVESGGVEQRRVRYVSYYIAQIQYSYSVDGEYYSGSLQRSFFNESPAYKFVDTLKGQRLFVRRNANHPERSALLKQDQPGIWPTSGGWAAW
jgi:hypothetical protein